MVLFEPELLVISDMQLKVVVGGQVKQLNPLIKKCLSEVTSVLNAARQRRINVKSPSGH